MKKISVIVPCFNGEKTLARCLDSILSQTYKHFEIIVVDDGSTDGSAALLSEYALKDSRVKLIKKENGGVGSARNLGLKHAGGDYIQFIDADDDIKQNMFEKMVNALQKTNSDIAVCRFSHCCFKAFLPAGLYNMQSQDDFKKFYLDFFSFNVPWNKLYKREIITEQYDETLKIFEDGLFVLSTLKNAGRIVLLEDELYQYFNAGAEDKNSAVNNFLKSKFWKTKEGYWYKFNAIKPMFDRVLKTSGCHDKVIEFARSFDMAFWELIKLIDSGCNQKICAMEFFGVLNQANFIESIKARNYAYQGASRKNVVDFIAACFKEFNSNANSGVHIGTFYDKFVRIFYEICLTRPQRAQCVISNQASFFDEIETDLILGRASVEA